jgi:hypothetical protein
VSHLEDTCPLENILPTQLRFSRAAKQRTADTREKRVRQFHSLPQKIAIQWRSQACDTPIFCDHPRCPLSNVKFIISITIPIPSNRLARLVENQQTKRGFLSA